MTSHPQQPQIVTFPPHPSHANAHSIHPAYNNAHLVRTIKAPHGLPTPPATGESSISSSTNNKKHIRRRRASAGASSTSTGGETTTSDGSGFAFGGAAGRDGRWAGKDASSFYASAAPVSNISAAVKGSEKEQQSSSSSTVRHSPTNPFFEPPHQSSSSNPSRYENLHSGQQQQHIATSASLNAGPLDGKMLPPPPRPAPAQSSRHRPSKAEQQRESDREREQEGKEAPYIRRGEMTYVL